MMFNDSSIQERSSLPNEQPADKGECSARVCDRDGHLRDAKYPKASSRQKASYISVVGPTHSRNFADQFRSQSSPLRSGRGSSPSGHDQPQLHRRNNRHRTGSQCGKENIPPLLCQSAKTHTADSRRLVLADVTDAERGGSESFDGAPFAGSTSIHSPSRKVDNGAPGTAGLRFELDHNPCLGNSDSQETLISTAQDSFVQIVIESADRPTGSHPELRRASPSTPLREALSSFNDIFSSTFTSPARKSTAGNDPPNTFRLLFRLPATPPLPTSVSISNAFNLSTLADSVSQLTEDIALSIAARYKNDHLEQDQYHEDAVTRDEKFHWEEEMRCLEVQCGLFGETK